MNKLYEIIEGNALITPIEDNIEPIIDGILYPENQILISAEEKAGKTILSQQIACSLSTGTSLFGVFDVDKPHTVLYLATEGRKGELIDRFIRMSKHVPMAVENIKLVPINFRFNTDNGMNALKEIVSYYENRDGMYPDVIIVDALYRAVKGSLKEDDVVNDFYQAVGYLAKMCNDAGVIIVHHLTKPSRNKDGAYYSRNDKDTFGSAFLTAGADHCFRLEKCKKNKLDRILYCDTQRSNTVAEKTRLRLIEPDPLYYEVVSHHIEEKAKLIKILNTKKFKGGINIDGIQKQLDIGRSTAYTIIKELCNDRVIRKHKDGRKISYVLV